jgi:hypothetical protein
MLCCSFSSEPAHTASLSIASWLFLDRNRCRRIIFKTLSHGGFNEGGERFLVIGSGIAGLSFGYSGGQSRQGCPVTKQEIKESATNYAGWNCFGFSEEDTFDSPFRTRLLQGPAFAMKTS